MWIWSRVLLVIGFGVMFGSMAYVYWLGWLNYQAGLPIRDILVWWREYWMAPACAGILIVSIAMLADVWVRTARPNIRAGRPWNHYEGPPQ